MKKWICVALVAVVAITGVVGVTHYLGNSAVVHAYPGGD